MGGKSKSSQRSRQSSTSESFIAPFQVPLFQNLGNVAQQVAFGQLPNVGATAQQLGGQFLSQGQNFLGSLGDISGGSLGQGFNSAVSGLQNLAGDNAITQQILAGGSNVGQQSLEALARGGAGSVSSSPLSGTSLLQSAGQGFGQLALQPNPGLQGSLDALNAAINTNLESTLGTIAGQATLAGGTGGSRQALASGLAAQESQRSFASGASGLISQDFAARQALAPALIEGQLAAGQALNQGDLGLRGLLSQASLADQGNQIAAAQAAQAGSQGQQSALLGLLGQQTGALGALGNLGLGGTAAQLDASNAGIAGAQNLFNLGISPFNAAFSPLLQLSQILGSPTVLNRGTQESRGRSKGGSFQIAPFPE